MQFAKIFNSASSWIIPNFIFLVSLLVFGNITTLPNQPIWDETYYIPAVQKYIDGTFFMESHPPLGKLLITSGELIVNPNNDYSNLNPIARLCMTNTYIDYDNSRISQLEYRKIYPRAINKSNLNNYNNINDENKLDRGYSFCGVRFMPAIFAIFIPLLLYILVLLLTNSKYLSLFISSLVIFENALITHYRAAMIDGIQMVFILLTLIFFVRIIQSKVFELNWNWFGMLTFITFAISCKHNAVFLLIFPILLLVNKIDFKSLLKLGISIGFIVILYSSIFMVHIDNGRQFVANSQDRLGYYNADQPTKDFLNKTSNDFNHLKILQSNMEYMQNYHLRVPVLDPSNPNENGSYPYTWPLMKKIINYNNSESKKLTLVGNPIIWALSLITVILAFLNLVKAVFQKDLIKNNYYQYLILFFGLYSGYLALMFFTSNLRVMYLYHYFIDLVLTFVMLGLIIKLNNWDTKNNLTVFIFLYILILIGFGLVSPYTYYLPTYQSYFLNKLI
jgi:dolichyl-phosphate-mannose-protein mannosyltransferase